MHDLNIGSWTSNFAGLPGYFNSDFFDREQRISSEYGIFRKIGSVLAINNSEKNLLSSVFFEKSGSLEK